VVGAPATTPEYGGHPVGHPQIGQRGAVAVVVLAVSPALAVTWVDALVGVVAVLPRAGQRVLEEAVAVGIDRAGVALGWAGVKGVRDRVPVAVVRVVGEGHPRVPARRRGALRVVAGCRRCGLIADRQRLHVEDAGLARRDVEWDEARLLVCHSNPRAVAR
jgi:hypothetical protein